MIRQTLMQGADMGESGQSQSARLRTNPWPSRSSRDDNRNSSPRAEHAWDLLVQLLPAWTIITCGGGRALRTRGRCSSRTADKSCNTFGPRGRCLSRAAPPLRVWPNTFCLESTSMRHFFPLSDLSFILLGHKINLCHEKYLRKEPFVSD